MADDDILINHLPQMADALHKAVSQAVRKAALDIEAGAKQAAPVDTGFLKNSIYAVTSAGSDYSNGDLPQVEAPGDDQSAVVAVGASYGIYVELGTAHMAAEPYLMPAAASVEASLALAMAQLIAAAMQAEAVK